jgi:hypothetical protein
VAKYRYAGVPLTPSVFAEMALKVIPRDQPISRPRLIELVHEAHQAAGGAPPTGSLIYVAKKALAHLAKDGYAQNLTPGHWRFTEPLSPNTIAEPVQLGDGRGAVYVYYFPAYRDQAVHLDKDSWPMKIGMTAAGEVPLRIRDQVGTAMPERPIVGLIYRTDSAANAERLLHSTLEARERRIVDAPGQEWFLTSLSEIREILDFATNGKSQST